MELFWLTFDTSVASLSLNTLWCIPDHLVTIYKLHHDLNHNLLGYFNLFILLSFNLCKCCIKLLRRGSLLNSPLRNQFQTMFPIRGSLEKYQLGWALSFALTHLWH